MAERDRLAVDHAARRRSAGPSPRGCRTARPGPGPRGPRRPAPRPGAARTTRPAASSRRQVADDEAGWLGPRCARRAARDAAGIDCGDLAEHQLHDALLRALAVTSTTPTVSPSRSTVARSHTAAISIMRCEMKITERSPPALAADDLEYPLGEVGGQCGRHLVEHQHVGLDRERAREVDDAQRGERQLAGLASRGRAARCPARPASDGTASSGVSVRRRFERMSRSGISAGSW